MHKTESDILEDDLVQLDGWCIFSSACIGVHRRLDQRP
jgi:hypothetical protein